MWRLAGCYEALYESHGLRAKKIIKPLERALEQMTREPEKFQALNSPNGWGVYPHALKFLEQVIEYIKTNQYKGDKWTMRVSR